MTAVHEQVGVRVRYFAAARAAAGVAEEVVRVGRSTEVAPTAGDTINAVTAAHGDRLAAVVTACSFLLNGMAVRDRSVEVHDGAELDVLPPFAGG
ncbi:MoaD/ThiS family protein [Saccharopolyspora mangrovi]|uniref:MoaD/ThiS family protein n=1 Tax=Saccharopolyspora mangrovi TaxID=3082379 RepID=A0ABU6A5K1_9PSEU|nr:MoaD/ThiS family protein [Saccharopolyspora sp. S2-29]MEB3366644.1 MoaD/ThiS family protein [Saccharopolyspora sp. S2-29]